ncbi:PDR/VanB family oxidoreductase [Caenimonas soli]|uniref:PDR/VanB family oxidoreductase n=1 Tax=Caenimonas soli TaxID=2735555 RepID=UPI001552ABC3|nr:PDR/VanB family oxidoreductase [Caenimonas soli]NPC58485.1 oxidoreductase [Caenimonas soli]
MVTRVLRVKSVTWEAPNILSFELTPLDDTELPSFTAGAHIDLVLPVGITRSYSLVNSQIERHRYVIAVQKDRATRGGSQWIHENLRPGDTVSVEGPRNHFALNEAAQKTIFIAAGIGITPIMSMIERMKVLKRDWELIYCARTRGGAAFRGSLENDPRVRFNFDGEPGGKILDIAALIRESPVDAHFYCCGPLPVLEAFESATEGLPSERVHLEYFAAKELPPIEGGFTVVLAKSGRKVTVSPGKSILETLRESGLDVPYSCGQGVCGTCDTAVLEGIPDHRDLILTKNERLSNKRMMICCSGAKSESLVLDL